MIRFDAFAKSYGAVAAVRALTMQIVAGETLALVGPNGSGKSTCLKAAIGLVRPSRGTVRLGDRDPFREPLARAAAGYLPQRLAFPESATASEIVAFHAAIRRCSGGRANSVLTRLGLEEVAGRRADTFSGGMRQRLGLAIAMVGDPALLVLDEPSAALDPSAALEVRHALASLGGVGDGSRTIVFSSHNLAEVGALADRVAVFVEGELRALGPPRELAAQFGLPSRLRLDGDADASGLAEAARRAGANGVRVCDGAVTCLAPPGTTARVIAAWRAAGSPLDGLRIREPGVEEVYRAATSPSPRLVA